MPIIKAKINNSFKKCTKCLRNLSLDRFSKRSDGKMGVCSQCKDCCNLRNKNYYSIHRQKIIKRTKNYRKNHQLKYNLNYNKRYKNDVHFRLRHNIARRILLSLKNLNKSCNTVKLLGCSIQFYKEYLESKFQYGMSWENHGRNGWHIDHIKPCIAFNLSNPEEQAKCFHYSNTQPLWAERNLSKAGS